MGVVGGGRMTRWREGGRESTGKSVGEHDFPSDLFLPKFWAPFFQPHNLGFCLELKKRKKEN